MRTRSIHGPGRIWRAGHLALSGAAVLLTIGTLGTLGVLGVLGAAPAQAMTLDIPLKPVIVVQPTTTQVNEPVTPSVTVAVDTDYGQVAWWYNGPVMLQYAVNPDSANLPTWNVAFAVGGIATFPNLAFSSVGFGFQLVAILTGTSVVPGTWGKVRTSGGPSQPSAPFDIVDQLLQCGAGQTCHGETVSSGGTSGSSAANTAEGSGQLASTGGGFAALSCTTAGGVVSFSSNLPQTITVTLAGHLADHHRLKSFNICWGSAEPFATKFGSTSAFNPVNNEYEGLLPNCSSYRPAPCVLSRSRTWWGPVVITALAPAGDPHMTY